MIAPAILLGITAGALVGLAIWAFVPASPHLGDTLARLGPSNLSLGQARTAPVAVDRKDAIGAWVERHLGRYRPFTAPTDDLELLDISPAAFYTEKVFAAGCGFVFPTLISVVDSTLLHLMPTGLPAFVGLIAAVVLWFAPDTRIRSKAKEARRDFSDAAVEYYRFIAINRRSERAVTPALESAAAISDSWMFVRIREALNLADWGGISAWDGLEALGTRVKVPELIEIAGIMRLAGDAGAAVIDSLVAGAEAMRDQRLKTQYDEAAQATTRTAAPRAALAFLVVITLCVPFVIQLLN